MKRLALTRENDALPLRKANRHSGAQIGALGLIGPTERDIRAVNDCRRKRGDLAEDRCVLSLENRVRANPKRQVVQGSLQRESTAVERRGER